MEMELQKKSVEQIKQKKAEQAKEYYNRNKVRLNKRRQELRTLKKQEKQNLPSFQSLFGHPSRILLKKPYGTYNRELVDLLQVQKSFFESIIPLGVFHHYHRLYIESLK